MDGVIVKGLAFLGYILVIICSGFSSYTPENVVMIIVVIVFIDTDVHECYLYSTKRHSSQPVR